MFVCTVDQKQQKLKQLLLLLSYCMKKICIWRKKKNWYFTNQIGKHKIQTKLATTVSFFLSSSAAAGTRRRLKAVGTDSNLERSIPSVRI